MMNDKFLRAITAGELAQADGKLTFKEVVWVISAWLSYAGECGYHLADPTAPVDRAELAAGLTQAWTRLSALVDDVAMPWSMKFAWATVKATVPAMIGPIASEIGARLDAGENHD